MIVRIIVWGIALVVFGAAFWLGLGGLKTRKTVHVMMVLRHFMIVFVSCSELQPISKTFQKIMLAERSWMRLWTLFGSARRV